jgi:predicted DNA-binding protein YlxM (UPF0122 family)
MPTFEQLRDQLLELHKTKTLREIAEETYDSKVNHAAIHRCIDGHEPTLEEIREVLELPKIIIHHQDRKTGRFVER